MAVAGFDRVLNLNLLVAAFFGDARICSIFSSSRFIAVVYDGFELSSLSISNESSDFLAFDSGVPYFEYKSSIVVTSFLANFDAVTKCSSGELKSAKISSSILLVVTLFTGLLKLASSSLIITQSIDFFGAAKFGLLCNVFTVRFSSTNVSSRSFDVGFGLNLNLLVLAVVFTVDEVLSMFAGFVVSFSLRDINVNNEDCFDIVIICTISAHLVILYLHASARDIDLFYAQ